MPETDRWTDRERRREAIREMRKARHDVHREIKRQRQAQSPPGRYLFWGLLLIVWAVLIFLLQRDWLALGDLWKAFLMGLGGIFIFQAIVYALMPSYRYHALGRLRGGLIFVFIGLGFLFGFTAWWPILLAGAGVVIVITSWLFQREVDKRRVAQETLHQSEVKYRHIIDNANSVIMEIDKAGNITFMNKFALGFFGFEEKEILGRNVVGTIIPPSAPIAAKLDSIINGIVEAPDEQENLRKNGEKVWMVWTYRPVFDEAGNLREILCTGIDRTEQKKAEELAARQMKEKTAVEERTRLARDLHDAVSQTLFSTSLIAEVLPKIWERNKDDGLKKLEEVRQLTRGALAEMRTLLFELRPAALADADLNDLLRQLAESVIGRARVPVNVELDGSRELPPDVKVALYRIAQEALNNVVKHSGASQAQVVLRCQPHEVFLKITDNGHGFDASKVTAGSFGLSNMKERAGQIGADLTIESKPELGTEVSVDWRDHAGEVPK